MGRRGQAENVFSAPCLACGAVILGSRARGSKRSETQRARGLQGGPGRMSHRQECLRGQGCSSEDKGPARLSARSGAYTWDREHDFRPENLGLGWADEDGAFHFQWTGNVINPRPRRPSSSSAITSTKYPGL